MRLPFKLHGRSEIERAFNEVIDYLRSLTPRPTDGVLTSHTPDGVFRKAQKTFPSKPSTGSDITRLQIVSIQSDYFTCHKWLGSAFATDTDYTYVAKRPKLRNSVTSESISGFSIGYTYPYFLIDGITTDTCQRLATCAGLGSPEHQVVDPQFEDGAEIHAGTVDGGTGVLDPFGKDITLIDLSERAWAKMGGT